MNDGRASFEAVRCQSMFIEHEKKAFFSYVAVFRSEDGGQGRAALARSSERSEDP
jgi:hypothetical protein